MQMWKARLKEILSDPRRFASKHAQVGNTLLGAVLIWGLMLVCPYVEIRHALVSIALLYPIFSELTKWAVSDDSASF